MSAPRHEFYETDDRLTVSIFDKGANPEQVEIKFEPRCFSYKHGDKELILQPLKGQVDPEKCDFTVGKVKVEIRLVKMVQGRWGGLIGDSPDPLANNTYAGQPTAATEGARKAHKNWDGITTDILKSDKDKSTEEDPNAGGDTAVNSFFRQLYDSADEDTKRAMMKSYSESGGTALSTNWAEVGKGPVEVKPPEGSEWKKWGA